MLVVGALVVGALKELLVVIALVELLVLGALVVMFSELMPFMDVLGELAVVVTFALVELVAVLAVVRFGRRRIGIVSVTPR